MLPAHLRIRNGVAMLNGSIVANTGSTDPADMYRALGMSYPKFFKMDKLCKWAWLGAEILLRSDEGGWRYEGADKKNIAVVMQTADGCLEVDKRYDETRAGIASPALFVYTLPNIALGEICIRHSFTGEQLCEVQDTFNADLSLFWTRDLLENRGATHCLFGWVNAVDDHHDLCFFWTDRSSLAGLATERLEQIYDAVL